MLCFIRAEYNGKTEFLYLPCEEEAIDKAFARLGTTADEMKITLEDFNTDSPECSSLRNRTRFIISTVGYFFKNLFPPRGNCAYTLTGATCHDGRRKWTTQLKIDNSRKKRQITLSRQRIRRSRLGLLRSKTALFSLLWGKKCGFYAMPRKKQLRNRWIYAII